VVRAEVVDVAGRRVSPLFEDGVLAAGAHRLRWDGRDASGHRVAAGVYLIRISADAATAVHRIVVIR
jgi:flagellar hook assembly protein FlgD